MKAIGMMVGALLVMSLTQAYGQKKIEKKEITKEVKVSEVNGEKVVTVITSENGKTKTETYKGAEATARLNELEGSDAAMNDHKVENGKNIHLENINGVKTLTITTVENGKSTTETYTGADADKKMEEIEKTMPSSGNEGSQEIRIRKTEKKKEEKKD